MRDLLYFYSRAVTYSLVMAPSASSLSVNFLYTGVIFSIFEYIIGCVNLNRI